MIPGIAILSIAVFIFTFKLSGVAPVALGVLSTTEEAINVFQDKSIDDRTREKSLQLLTLKLFRAFFSILIRSILTLLTSFIPIWLTSLMGWVRIEDVVHFLYRWDVITAGTFLFIVVFFISAHMRPAPDMDFQMNYSLADRLIHATAFGIAPVQLTAADIEKVIWGSTYQTVIVEKPIFISSLPRAGTTLMLNVLHQFPSMATHTYRDMPYIMAPILWSRLSKSFHKRAKPRERAHGDGMQVDYDSPEAFEEVLWHTFWPEKYSAAGIDLWGRDDIKEDAQLFFTEHMKKIISLRLPERKFDGRYLSKNNANIARLDLIGHMFPKAKILVPVRHPIEHAASLHRQHLHFSEIHKSQTFSRRYMADIGHYEFGELHRPIHFPGIVNALDQWNPLEANYWLAYWLAAFEHVLTRRDKVILISYEAICADGRNGLSELCLRLEIPEEGMLDKLASHFKKPSLSKGDKIDFSRRLRSRAEELHEALIKERS